jgi:hypothetical protein
MRTVFGAVVSVLFGLAAGASAQTCTGLCLQQVSCPNGGTTSISGTIYVPNGTDPLPNALVYIPNAAVAAFTPGVSCPVPGAPPSGSPLVGTTTAVDGTFTLTNVPVGQNVPLVVVSGRWRLQVVVPSTAACANTPFSTQMPSTQAEGDIPKIAIVTGNADQVECVLRKVGVADSEFLPPSGRITLYTGNGGPGAVNASPNTTPTETDLMGSGNSATLNQYDVLMLPCQGAAFEQSNAADNELANFASFANQGGRVYSSHYSYVYMNGSDWLPPVANWTNASQVQETSAEATVNTSFAEGETLAQWLQLTGATTTEGQISLSTIRHDMDGVIAPTQSWMTLNQQISTDSAPVMQFVFNTPVAATNQCGKVLFNEYHVENPTTAAGSSSKSIAFPLECPAAGTPLTPQEKLLEYSLFELTNDGGAPTLTPTSANFGNVALGFTSAPTNFTFTNNSVFPVTATASVATANYAVSANTCTNVPSSSSCTISVVFKPTALGTLNDTLTVNSSGPSLAATLTGVGIPSLSFSGAALQFGSHDVGSSSTQTLTVTNTASGPVSFPGLATTGDYSANSNCPSTLAPSAVCAINVTFVPTSTGDRPGTLTVGTNTPITLDGNGIDFTIGLAPTSGSVEAGLATTTTATLTPLAGFGNGLLLTCTTDATAATCVSSATNVTLAATTTEQFTITTVSQYTVVGYEGGMFWLVGLTTGGLLWWRRRTLSSRWTRAAGLTVLLVMTAVGSGFSTLGCSGKYPAKNAAYTVPGTYAVTITATDGFLSHTATYSMKVTQ